MASERRGQKQGAAEAHPLKGTSQGQCESVEAQRRMPFGIGSWEVSAIQAGLRIRGGARNWACGLRELAILEAEKEALGLKW